MNSDLPRKPHTRIVCGPAALLCMLVFVSLFVACSDVTKPKESVQSSRVLTNAASVINVSPANMRGWTFQDDQRGTQCDSMRCHMVAGPSVPTFAGGSAELVLSGASEGVALALPAYGGTRLDRLTEIRYATFRQTADSGNNLAIALQLNVDYDITDNANGYQGRIVFEPYQGNSGGVTQGN